MTRLDTHESSRSADDHLVPRSVGRVLDLLEVVLREQSCNLTSAASATALTPTTALRHLRALEVRGYVHRDASGLFSAGPTLIRIAAALRHTAPLEALIATAQPYLDRLARDTGESTYLAVSDGTIATYVAAAESERAIRHVGWIGQNVALHGTAVGEALTHPGKVAVRTGAVEPDTTAVSLALSPSGALAVVAVGVAISVVGPEHRLGPKQRKRVTAALTAATEQLARDLGYSEDES